MMLQNKSSDEEGCLDQFYFIHSNKLVLVGISPKHDAIVNHGVDPIIEIKFDKTRLVNISGKNKKGSTKVDFCTIICEIITQSGKTYKIRSFVNGAKIIELNEKLEENINLLVTKPETEGFLAIFMMAQLEHGVSEEDSVSKLIKKFHEGDKLLVKEHYF